MRIAVRYQSHGGNTKAVAEAIAEKAGVKAESIDVPLDEPVDLLYIGGGAYKWDIDPTLRAYMTDLAPSMVMAVAVYMTAGGMNFTKRTAALATEKGIPVCDDLLPVLFGVRNHATFSKKGHVNLSEKQLHAVDEFVKRTMAETETRSKETAQI